MIDQVPESSALVKHGIRDALGECYDLTVSGAISGSSMADVLFEMRGYIRTLDGRGDYFHGSTSPNVLFLRTYRPVYLAARSYLGN